MEQFVVVRGARGTLRGFEPLALTTQTTLVVFEGPERIVSSRGYCGVRLLAVWPSPAQRQEVADHLAGAGHVVVVLSPAALANPGALASASELRRLAPLRWATASHEAVAVELLDWLPASLRAAALGRLAGLGVCRPPEGEVTVDVSFPPGVVLSQPLGASALRLAYMEAPTLPTALVLSALRACYASARINR